MNPPSLELRELRVHAGRQLVAGPLSLVHYAGSILWITGENGAGKSSLLRMLARRQRAHGTLTHTPAAHTGSTSYYAPVMQFAPGPHVRDWLALHRRLVPYSPQARLVDALLPGHAQGPLVRLSTGEAKRLVLWSVLRLPRAFYVLDEPFEHLSPAGKAALAAVLAALVSRAVVVVATNQPVIAEIPARVLELDE